MKKNLLSLLICATVSCSAYAETSTHVEYAHDGITYDAIVVKLKPGKPLLKSTGGTTANTLTLSEPSLVPSTMFRPTLLRGSEASEMAQLNTRYGFDRYLRITLPEGRSQDKDYINQVIAEIEQKPNVETVYPESLPVSLEEYRHSDSFAPPKLKSTINQNLGAAAVPDFRHLQDYLKSPTEKRQGYFLGGVNRDSVNQYAGNDGAGVTIVSEENCAWNPAHINLPPIAFSQGNKQWQSCGNHDSASVGIMAARDIGAGVKGLAWNTRVGFASWQVNNLYNTIPLLKAGDVLQMGMQTGGGEVTGCKSECYMPQESAQAYYDLIKALTDKGVYVIEAAGNGNINLDNPVFNGKFDVNVRDSGAILAGAACAKEGKRAYFSTYGSRVTSASWGCWDVVSTGYGDLWQNGVNNYTNTFAGTSSANPIIAGVVASLSGIAKANGITVTPLQMRQILQETGTPLAGNESAKIGTQPDMERAVAKIMALKDGDSTAPAPTAEAGADKSMVSSANSVTTWPLDGSKSLNVKSFSWRISKGGDKFGLQAKQNGALVESVEAPQAWAVIPANAEGDVTYTLTTTGADGRTAQDSVTLHVSKPNAPATDVPAYSARTVYSKNCTKVAYGGKIWQNQWYVNPGQETPGTGGQWGAWREVGASNNSCR